MKVKLKGYDIKNNIIDLPKPLSYEMHFGECGIDIWFSFKFAKEISSNLVKVDVIIENGKVYSCFIDIIQRNLNKHGDYFLLKVRSVICRIWQNQVRPIEYKNYGVVAMFDKYVRPYGINKLKFNTNKVALNNFYVELGMTAWDVVSIYCKKAFDTYPIVDENFELGSYYYPSKPVVFGTGIKYLSLVKSEDRSRVISRVYIKSESGLDFSGHCSDNLAAEAGVERVRYYKAPKQWSILPNRGAEYLIYESGKKRYRYEITLSEHIDVYPGMIAKIKGKVEGKGICYISEVHFSFNEKGPLTKIVLYSNVVQ